MEEQIIIALLGGYGILSSVIAYLYKQKEADHKREINSYQERIESCDKIIAKLGEDVAAMQSRLDTTYQRFLDKLNGRNKNGVIPKS